MATWLKQNTAVNIALGPFLDDVDGKTAEIGLSIAASATYLTKGSSGTWAAKNEGTTAVHQIGGWYQVFLNATDTNTVGMLGIMVHLAGALPVWREFMVVPANVYDSIIGNTDKLEVDVQQVSNVTSSVGAAMMGVNLVAIEAIAPPSVYIRDSLFTGVVENSKTFVQLFRGMVAALLGKSSGLAGTTARYRDDADTKDRIVATVDADGNRSVVTKDLT